jgi:hypothetical protein
MPTGFDYAWTHPSPAALKAADAAFVCRYLAADETKALTKAEAVALAAEGIWSVVVWESTATRMLGGKTAGVADAKTASAQAVAAGQPSSRPIYFAADWDATEAQQVSINAYLDGAASVLGRDRVGIYGGYYPVKRALDAGKAKWAWQTIAWSGGLWDARANIRQGAQKTIGGVSCDINTSMTSDYGQWMPGKTPTPEDDMTPEQAEQLAQVFSDTAALRKNLLHIDSLDEKDSKGKPVEHAAGYYLAHGQHDSLAAFNAAVKAQTPAVALTDTQLDALAVKVAPLLAEDLAEKLAARLQS